MSGRLAGKRALITGASSGIGAATARLFAAEGARLVLAADDEAGLHGEVRAIREAGGSAEAIAGDLADRGFCRCLVKRAVALMGGLDVLVNNAGVNRRGTAEETSDEDWDLVMAVNLAAPFFVSRAAIPAMRAAGGGVIVNTASELAFIGTLRAAAYCASKGGVVQLTRAMALDHARDGIRINAICPGPVDTALLRSFRDDPEGEVAAIAEATPLGRVGRVEEIAHAILFLASDEASFMTGAPMIVDGGATAW